MQVFYKKSKKCGSIPDATHTPECEPPTNVGATHEWGTNFFVKNFIYNYENIFVKEMEIFESFFLKNFIIL